MRSTTLLSQNGVHYKNYLLLLLICLLAYWPLTFGIFSVKNDAIHYFLPYRFHISEALRNGEGPFWSPYLYLGNPIQGDMQSGAWNPVVWIFSAIGRYDLTLFHYEYLLYIFLGGVGMYKLTNRLVDHSHTALLIAVSYMLSGFMLSGQLINWLAAAAFLPFVIHYYLLTNHTLSVRNAVKTGIALFLLFTAGYPSFFILTAYLLVILFFVALVEKIKTKDKAPGKFLLVQLPAVLVFAGLSLPAIVSYIDLLPYYQRGGGTSFRDTVTNAFDLQHTLSVLFPLSIKANDIVSETDVTCRNIYFGIFPLLILSIFPPKLSRRNIQLLLLTVFALLFSLGDSTPIRKLCYQFLPLMDTFRHPSQMRLFFILAVLLLAVPGVKKLLNQEYTVPDTKKIKRVAWISACLLLIVAIVAFTQSGIFSNLQTINTTGPRFTLKNIIDAFSLADTFLLNALLQLLFIIVFILWCNKSIQSRPLFSCLWITNMLIMAQLVLPASFVSKVSPKEINQRIHASAPGFPVTGLQNTLAENSKDAFDNYNTTGLSYFYNKRIGISKVTNSPAFLEQEDTFIQTKLLYNYVASLPVAYFADSVHPMKDTILLGQPGGCLHAFNDMPLPGLSCTEKKSAIITKISANRFEIATETNSNALLVLTQNYYHYWQVSVDGEPGKITKVNMCFMGIIVPAGTHKVIFSFVPHNTIKALWVQLAVLLILLCSGLYFIIKRNRQ